MANTLGKRGNGGDEENTAFGCAAKVAEHKAGFDRKVAKQVAETGKHPRRRPSAEKDIPKESLAARAAASGSRAWRAGRWPFYKSCRFAI